MKTTTLLLLAGVFFTGNVFAPTKAPHTPDPARVAAAKTKKAQFDAVAKMYPSLSAPNNDHEWDIASFCTGDTNAQIEVGKAYFEHKNVSNTNGEYAGRCEKSVSGGPNTDAQGDGGFWDTAPAAYKAIYGNVKPS